jgi:heme-degrading monooxygenase HmoA
MVVVVSKFVVSNGMQREVAKAFKNRPHKVDSAPGFVRLEVLSPAENDAEFWLVTYWSSEQHYREWHQGHRHDSHEFIPHGLKLDSRGTELRLFHHLAS